MPTASRPESVATIHSSKAGNCAMRRARGLRWVASDRASVAAVSDSGWSLFWENSASNAMADLSAFGPEGDSLAI